MAVVQRVAQPFRVDVQVEHGDGLAATIVQGQAVANQVLAGYEVVVVASAPVGGVALDHPLKDR